MKRHLELSLLICMLFSACEKEELPIPAYNRGEIKNAVVALGSDYSLQVWFDLNTNSVVKSNMKTDWDLSFDCAPASHIVHVNSSRLMQAAETKTENFDSVKTIQGLLFRPDHPGRNIDSLAIGDFKRSANILVIDLGYATSGAHMGYKKIKINENQDATFTIVYANLDGSDFHSINIIKRKDLPSIGFSFAKNELVEIEPISNSYTFCFTQYTYFFYNPYMPYLVTGVLINKNGVSAAEVINKKFEEINISDINSHTFSDSLDIIGYSWKAYDFSTSAYKVFPDKNYIIKDVSGFYYKLHFIDFYNEKGEKGYPKFEYRKL